MHDDEIQIKNWLSEFALNEYFTVGVKSDIWKS